MVNDYSYLHCVAIRFCTGDDDVMAKQIINDVVDFIIGFIAISPLIGLVILVWELGQWLSR